MGQEVADRGTGHRGQGTGNKGQDRKRTGTLGKGQEARDKRPGIGYERPETRDRDRRQGTRDRGQGA